MINETTFKSIAASHLNLKESGVTLAVLPDSPLHILNDASNTPILGLNTISDEEFFQQLPESLKRDTITGETSPSELSYDDGENVLFPAVGEHELVLNELADMARSRVAELFDHSRNVFQPFVKSVVSGYAEPQQSELSESWSIVDVALHPTYMNPVVGALLGQYAKPELLAWETEKGTQVKIPEDLSVPETGRASFDALVKELLTSLDMSAKDVMVKLLGDGTCSPYRETAWVNAPLRLVQWLLVNYYTETPWADSGMSAIQWDNFMTGYKNALAGWIARYLGNLNDLIESDTLVIGTNFTTREIYVVWDVYKKFKTEHGGRPDTIYGAVYLAESDNALQNYSLSTFVTRMKDCEAAWARQLSIKENKINAEWLISSRAHMKRAFASAIDSLESDILPDNVTKTGLKEQCAELIEARLDRFSMEDPTLLIIRIASESVFAYTDCGFVVENIHQQMAAGTDAKEAATQVAIDYVLNWILSGIIVK